MIKSILRKRQQLYILAPFLLLVFCLGSLNVGHWLISRPLETEVMVTTAVPYTTRTPILSLTNPPPTTTAVLPTITPTPQPLPTLYTPPIYSDDTIIQLLGPPTDSTFAAEATVSFYWQWPLALSEDQFFAVTLLTEDGVQIVGTVHEPNVGDHYRLHMRLEDVGRTAVSLQWQVTLSTTFTPQPLRTSETRSLQILESR